jgi:hypothetical protein
VVPLSEIRCIGPHQPWLHPGTHASFFFFFFSDSCHHFLFAQYMSKASSSTGANLPAPRRLSFLHWEAPNRWIPHEIPRPTCAQLRVHHMRLVRHTRIWGSQSEGNWCKLSINRGLEIYATAYISNQVFTTIRMIVQIEVNEWGLSQKAKWTRGIDTSVAAL